MEAVPTSILTLALNRQAAAVLAIYTWHIETQFFSFVYFFSPVLHRINEGKEIDIKVEQVLEEAGFLYLVCLYR